MGATTRHCLVLLTAMAVVFLVAWPAVAASAAAWQGQPWAADWPLYLRWWGLASATLGSVRLLLAGANWLLRTMLRNY